MHESMPPAAAAEHAASKETLSRALTPKDVAKTEAAPRPTQPHVWEFDAQLKSSNVAIEVEGSRCQFTSIATALLVAPPLPPCAVVMKLVKASSYLDGICDAVGMCPPAAAYLPGTLADHERVVQGASDSSVGGSAMGSEAQACAGVGASSGGGGGDGNGGGGDDSRAGIVPGSVAVCAAGSFVVRTRFGNLAPARALGGFETDDEILMALDEERTLSLAVNGDEVARFGGVPDGWRFAISGGPRGVWELIDKPLFSSIETSMDTAAAARAFARHDYAEDEAATEHLRTWVALMRKRERAHQGRMKQLAALVERQWDAEEASAAAEFEAYEQRCDEQRSQETDQATDAGLGSAGSADGSTDGADADAGAPSNADVGVLPGDAGEALGTRAQREGTDPSLQPQRSRIHWHDSDATGVVSAEVEYVARR